MNDLIPVYISPDDLDIDEIYCAAFDAHEHQDAQIIFVLEAEPDDHNEDALMKHVFTAHEWLRKLGVDMERYEALTMALVIMAMPMPSRMRH